MGNYNLVMNEEVKLLVKEGVKVLVNIKREVHVRPHRSSRALTLCVVYRGDYRILRKSPTGQYYIDILQKNKV